jgi:transcriptional regulator with GAF, ATPase, and Fis domain
MFVEPEIVAESPSTKLLLKRIETIAMSDSLVLLVGETGVGKELIAQYIHWLSPRAQRPFVKVGFSAIPAHLLESELFGHERGAYTSATETMRGPFELAHTGSMLLDDIDDLPVSLQGKILHVLETGELKRVGGAAPTTVNVRFIVATKVDLKRMVDRGRFRSDLYYRLNVVPVQIPPLRDRREDILPLLRHYLGVYAPNRNIVVSDDACRLLTNYSWPGNVREVKNIAQRMVLLDHDAIHCGDIEPEIYNDNPVETIARACSQCFVYEKMSLETVMNCLESNLLRYALMKSGGVHSKAARMLGVHPSTLGDKLKKHGLNQVRSPLNGNPDTN